MLASGTPLLSGLRLWLPRARARARSAEAAILTGCRSSGSAAQTTLPEGPWGSARCSQGSGSRTSSPQQPQRRRSHHATRGPPACLQIPAPPSGSRHTCSTRSQPPRVREVGVGLTVAAFRGGGSDSGGIVLGHLLVRVSLGGLLEEPQHGVHDLPHLALRVARQLLQHRWPQRRHIQMLARRRCHIHAHTRTPSHERHTNDRRDWRGSRGDTCPWAEGGCACVRTEDASGDEGGRLGAGERPVLETERVEVARERGEEL
eukprot:scaffold1630_cov298-Prasinococcus_capsulatus_cf.AAC.10